MNHIELNNFSKVKVKYAVQIFNNHVVAGMCTQMSSDFLPTEAVATRFNKSF